MIICRLCKQSYDLPNFGLKNNSYSSFRTTCEKCYNSKSIQWNYKNPEKMAEAREKFRESGKRREWALRTKYGITTKGYVKILDSQSGGCAICGSKETGERNVWLHVDHSHKDNKVRGILCNNCNRGLGYFKDNIDTLRNAIKYLNKQSGK